MISYGLVINLCERIKLMKKFTLIELLVVVAIMGILLSILLPSLSKARQKGLSAVCKNNLKTQMLAMELYIDEEDVYPSLVTGSPGSIKYWARPSRVYIDFDQNGLDTPFKCPSDDRYNPHTWEISYGFNYWYLSNENPSNVADPTETILTADSGHNGDEHVWNNRTPAGYIINNKASWAGPIGPRHLKSGNILWVDGHVSATSQMVQIHATNDKWDLE